MRKFRDEQTGSAVVLVIFILSLMMGGFMYTQMAKVVVEIENIVENDTTGSMNSVTGGPLTDDTAYQLQVWMFTYGVPILIMIGLSLWFVRSLRKDRYQEL